MDIIKFIWLSTTFSLCKWEPTLGGAEHTLREINIVFCSSTCIIKKPSYMRWNHFIFLVQKCMHMRPLRIWQLRSCMVAYIRHYIPLASLWFNNEFKNVLLKVDYQSQYGLCNQ